MARVIGQRATKNPRLTGKIRGCELLGAVHLRIRRWPEACTRRGWGCLLNRMLEEPPVPVVYWHRQLPPLDAELVGSHTVDANSGQIAGILTRGGDRWDRCHRELMGETERRLVQEVARLGGDFARVYDEAIEPRHDEASGRGWLHGRFSYMLYRRPDVLR